MTLSSPLTELKGVGDVLAEKFSKLGVKTIADLIDYYPRRYEDYSQITEITRLKPGPVTIEAVILQAKGRFVRRGLHITEAVASDNSGSVRLVWFNQPYRAAALKSGQTYYISGEYELSRQRFAIMNPGVEKVSDFTLSTARILPVYRETKGLSSRQIRAALKEVMPQIKSLPETLPLVLVQAHKLLSRAAALSALHFPESAEQLESARRRLGFEEVLQLALASLMNKQENQSEPAVAVEFNEKLAKDFVSHLPFKLTDGQRRTIWQIYLDMQKAQPMNRLVEGDVGSGKTVVAAMAALMVVAEDRQVAFMAPTELLARQHYYTVCRLYNALGFEDKVALITGSLKPAQKKKVQTDIKSGRVGLIIGTHALIQEKIDMHKLALIVVDEQHRFGVEQRKKLMAKAGHMPHVLSLTATPIPRTLALTLYGELDISVLKEKPAGRQPIITQLVAPGERAELYAKIDIELQNGRQMFVVCPLITDSDIVGASAAEETYGRIKHKDFKHRRIGLLHGKLKTEEKQTVMERFIRHELDILVATTVIEVGVDVPNASIMMVESAQAFGLAQLHQLRGRVGRGQHQAHCYLMLDDTKSPSSRLRALVSSNDGFRLAELDLELRGPGAIYGTLQHGQLDLRIAKLTDTELIAEAREAAKQLLDDQLLDKNQSLLKYKVLMQHINRIRKVTNLN